MIGRVGAGFVQRCLPLQRAHHDVPVVDRARPQRILEIFKAGTVVEQMMNAGLRLTGLAELGPVANHRSVKVDQTPVGQHVDHERGHAFRDRHHVDDRVALPGFGVRAVGMTAPEIDHEPPVDIDRAVGADLFLPLEILGERLAHTLESRVARPSILL